MIISLCQQIVIQKVCFFYHIATDQYKYNHRFMWKMEKENKEVSENKTVN